MPSLSVALEVSDNIVVGLSVLATLRVTNHGASPATVSARLNLMEGDVRLILTSPDSEPRVIQGWQADTALRQVTLQPGEQIVGVMNLLQSESGPLFTVPGSYSLQAQFSPSVRDEQISAPPVLLTARLPQTELERGAAQVLKDQEASQAIVMAEADTAPEKLEQLATKFAEIPDGQLAQLLLAGRSQSGALKVTDPLSQALMIVALSTPFSRVGLQLSERFAAQLEAQDDAAKGGLAGSGTIKKALSIVRGQPIQAA